MSQQLLGSIYSNKIWVVLLLVWTIVWKGLALWKAARNNQKYWFIPLLIVNLFGLPEIIYLFFFQKEGRWTEKVAQRFLVTIENRKP